MGRGFFHDVHVSLDYRDEILQLIFNSRNVTLNNDDITATTMSSKTRPCSVRPSGPERRPASAPSRATAGPPSHRTWARSSRPQGRRGPAQRLVEHDVLYRKVSEILGDPSPRGPGGQFN